MQQRSAQTPVTRYEPVPTAYEYGTDKPSLTNYQPPVVTTTTSTAATTPSAADTKASAGATAAILACACCTGVIGLACGIFVIAFSLLSIILPILEIYFGKKYQDQCPAEPDIPEYLYLAGVLGLFPTILSIVTSIATCFITAEQRKNSKIIGIISIALRVISAIANFILALFLIYLVYLTFSIYRKVQYDRKADTKTYCHKKLYQFTLFIVILNIISAFLLCCCGSSVPERTKKAPATTENPVVRRA